MGRLDGCLRWLTSWVKVAGKGNHCGDVDMEETSMASAACFGLPVAPCNIALVRNAIGAKYEFSRDHHSNPFGHRPAMRRSYSVRNGFFW